MAVDFWQTLISAGGAIAGTVGGLYQSVAQLKKQFTAYVEKVDSLSKKVEELEGRLKRSHRPQSHTDIVLISTLKEKVDKLEADLEEMDDRIQKGVSIDDFEEFVKGEMDAWQRIQRELGGIQATLEFLKAQKR